MCPSRSLKMSSFDRAHMTSYYRSIATMGLSRTVSDINGDFIRKSQIFLPTLVFCAPAGGIPLGIGYRCWISEKTRMMGLPGRQRSLTISSAVWIQCTNVTDGRTDTGRQQRPRLRIASRGKKKFRSFAARFKPCGHPCRC